VWFSYLIVYLLKLVCVCRRVYIIAEPLPVKNVLIVTVATVDKMAMKSHPPLLTYFFMYYAV
jgi:hypothetical protein